MILEDISREENKDNYGASRKITWKKDQRNAEEYMVERDTIKELKEMGIRIWRRKLQDRDCWAAQRNRERERERERCCLLYKKARSLF